MALLQSTDEVRVGPLPVPLRDLLHGLRLRVGERAHFLLAELQTRLRVLANEKTEQLYIASIPTALPDIRKGVRVKAS